MDVIRVCSHSGEITFVSKAFGDRTTDCELTVNSGFIDLVEPGDLIMADKVRFHNLSNPKMHFI